MNPNLDYKMMPHSRFVAMQSADVARSYFEDAPNVEVVEMPINDGWTRDWGPSVSCLFRITKLTVF